MFNFRHPSKFNFVKVGRGRLTLYHRPRSLDFPDLRKAGCTHLVTLLREDEGAGKFRELSEKNGITWIGVPVPNGKYPEGEVHERLIAAMPELSRLLDEGKSLLIHCSAGIHRTGTVAYGLLRWRGIDSTRAMQIIAKARRETAEGMMEKRMRWGDENARPASKDTTWLHSVKEFASQLTTGLFKPR
jgi:protein-tyrosine phosphatase